MQGEAAVLDRFGRGHVFNWSTIGVAVCVAVLAITHSWFVDAVTVLFALAQIAGPATTIISMRSITPRWQPSMSSANLISLGLSAFLTATLGGLMIGAVGFRTFFFASVGVTMIGVALFWFSFNGREHIA
jgi:predicted MFS family arabinose efflux permease